MEIREFAERIFQGETLEEKLFQPAEGIRSLSDRQRGEAVMWRSPGRASQLQIDHSRRHKRLPRPGALHDANMRIRCLHTFANHELMALEMMAWALLAYPEAPEAFRLGLVKIIEDEQRHFKMYVERIEAMGAGFGDLPLNDHFWRVAHTLTDPIRWVCGMHLTFEQANLDHAPFFCQRFTEVGDHQAAALMEQIYLDEIMHVRFGGHWLRQLKPEEQSEFDAFEAHLAPNHPLHRARGTHFNAEGRIDAGLSCEFVEAMEHCRRDPHHQRTEES